MFSLIYYKLCNLLEWRIITVIISLLLIVNQILKLLVINLSLDNYGEYFVMIVNPILKVLSLLLYDVITVVVLQF